MAELLAVPLFLTGPAEDRLEELAIPREFAEVIAYTGRVIPRLRGVEVDVFYGDPHKPHLMLLAYRCAPGRMRETERLVRKWFSGLNRVVPPHIAAWFLLDIVYWTWTYSCSECDPFVIVGRDGHP